MGFFNRVLAAGMAVLAMGGQAGAAAARDFPAKPIRLMVVWPAGGTVDTVARALAATLAQSLGQPVVVENRPGASGTIGARELAAAPPDGYTLGVIFDTQSVNHHLYRNLGYDPLRSFTYLSRLVSAPQILVARNDFPADDVAGLIAHARAHPGRVTYASTGAGSSNHLQSLLLSQRAGVEMTHVPYKGGMQALTDIAGGQVDLMIVSAPSTIPLVAGGKIKALATGSLEPLAQLPAARPIAETIPAFEAASWVGLVAPAGLAPAMVARWQREVAQALAQPELRQKLEGAGYRILNDTPEAFTRFIAEESRKWGEIVQTHRIGVD